MTVTPPPLPTEDSTEPAGPRPWTVSLDVPVGSEAVHVVARTEPDTAGEIRIREALSGKPMGLLLIPQSFTDWMAIITAALIVAGVDGEVAAESVDALPPGAVLDAVTYE